MAPPGVETHRMCPPPVSKQLSIDAMVVSIGVPLEHARGPTRNKIVAKNDGCFMVQFPFVVIASVALPVWRMRHPDRPRATAAGFVTACVNVRRPVAHAVFLSFVDNR